MDKEEIYFQPSLDEFKKQFKAFAFSDDESITDTESPNIIDVKYLEELLTNKSLEVKKIIIDNGYEAPTVENKSPVFSLKQYIMFTVAEVFTSTYASNSDLINYIREEAKRYKEDFFNNFGNIVISSKNYDNIALNGNIRKP